MPSWQASQEKVKRLQKRARHLEKLHAGLQQEHDQLQLRCTFLAAWSAGMELLEESSCCPWPSDQIQAGMQAAAEDGHSALQQLMDAAAAAFTQQPPPAEHAHAAAHATVAPASEPLALFLRSITSPLPGLAWTMTEQQLALAVRNFTMEMGMALHALEALPPGRQLLATVTRVRQLWQT